jgi:uncharacterized membrane protein YphA (DoxX/SURF4 family)
MTEMIQMPAISRKRKMIGLWALRVLVGVAFVAAGVPKLLGAPVMVELFAKVGAGQWLRVVTGMLEVGGAVGLFVPRFTIYAAALLAAVMAAAIVSHLTVLGGNPATPIVLLLLTGTIAWLSRDTRGTW